MPDQSRLPEMEGLSKEIERTRDICRLAQQLLKTTTPDTFLGRKTQEPFALEISAAKAVLFS